MFMIQKVFVNHLHARSSSRWPLAAPPAALVTASGSLDLITDSHASSGSQRRKDTDNSALNAEIVSSRLEFIFQFTNWDLKSSAFLLDAPRTSSSLWIESPTGNSFLNAGFVMRLQGQHPSARALD